MNRSGCADIGEPPSVTVARVHVERSRTCADPARIPRESRVCRRLSHDAEYHTVPLTCDFADEPT
jgi:hypothetical protein